MSQNYTTVTDPGDGPAVVADLYLRFSDVRVSDLNADGLVKGLVEAERLLRDEAARLRWTVGRVLVENDMIDGKPKSASAYKRRPVMIAGSNEPVMRTVRPAFREGLERMRTGATQGMLFVDLDRAARDPRDLEDLIDIVRTSRANVRSITRSLTLTNGGTNDERYMARSMVNVAQKFSADKARQVAVARLRQARNGDFGGGVRRYGFEPDGVTVNEPEAAIIREVADDVLAGVPMRSQARALTERGVTTAQGKAWTGVTLREMMLRPRNAGHVIHHPLIDGQRPKRCKGLCDHIAGSLAGEPIIPDDLWQTVAAVLTDANRVTAVNGGPAHHYLGSGIYRCPCGTSVEILRATTKAPAYRCARQTRKDGGVHVMRNLAKTDAVVVEYIVERFADKAAAHLWERPATNGDDPADLRRQLGVLDVAEEQLAVAFAKRRKGGALAAGLATIDAERVEIQERLDACSPTALPFRKMIGAADPLAVWQAMSLGAQRATLRALVTVTIRPTIRSTRFHPEHIEIIDVDHDD